MRKDLFKLIHKDTASAARAGILNTEHGLVETPVFMPVGTVASVKAVTQQDLVKEVKAQIILSNAYHLFIRPGMDIMRKAGGLHKFMNTGLPILTDSGGYQVYSLSPTRKIKDDGVEFTSFLDGRKHFFSPETVIDIQRVIGSDIMMPLDECAPYPAEYSYVKKSLKLTHAWLQRAAGYNYTGIYGQGLEGITAEIAAPRTLFGIVQGGTYPDLREESAKTVADMNLDGNAIGGLSVGEPADKMYAMTETVCRHLPEDKPRYLMGVGKPENLLESIALGIDMFDCVMPTRNARNGWIFTRKGIINLVNSKWKDDFSELDPDGTAFVDSYYSRAYVRHLLHAKEMLGAQICTLHNLAFYIQLMSEARRHIADGTFAPWKAEAVKDVTRRL